VRIKKDRNNLSWGLQRINKV